MRGIDRMAMVLYRLKYTHVRFEPEVDGGTTYAFNFSFPGLVFGRARMYRLVQTIGHTGRDIESLNAELVNAEGPFETVYPDPVSLLIDVTRLVNAHILSVAKDAAAARGMA